MALLEDIYLPSARYSNFNRSKKWRSTMRPGVLYPCLFERVLPGTMVKMSARSILSSVQLEAPLMGSFKLQIDTFWIPLRLYNLDLRLNTNDFDRDMSLPTYITTLGSSEEFIGEGYKNTFCSNNSLLQYLGLPAYHFSNDTASSMNGVGILGYYDIFRQFYMNQQESTFPLYSFSYNGSTGFSLDTSIQSITSSNIDAAFKDFLTNDRDVNTFLTSLLATKFNSTTFGSGDCDGLCCRTYLSDMNSCFISQASYNSVNTVTAVDTSSGSFTMNQLLIADKLFDSYNKEMVAGSKYSDFMKSQYAVRLGLDSSAPTLLMSSSSNLWFETIVSTASVDYHGESQPLGELGGRGQGKLDGDSVSFVADEIGYIMSIASIIPRVDYYQSIQPLLYDTYFSDFYNNSLDCIGFQSLPLSQLYGYPTLLTDLQVGTYPSFSPLNSAAFANYFGFDNSLDTFYTMNGSCFDLNHSSAIGYQPAWTDYMSNFDTIHGDFVDSLRYWTLARSNMNVSTTSAPTLVTPYTSTYIRPDEYNFAFADIDGQADNFFVQIAFDLMFNAPISKQLMPKL